MPQWHREQQRQFIAIQYADSPYAPDRNPDEFLNNDLKQAMARRRTPKDKAGLKSGLTSYMRSLQKRPAKIKAFFQAPSVRYAA